MTPMETALAIIFSVAFPAFIAFEIWYFKFRKRKADLSGKQAQP